MKAIWSWFRAREWDEPSLGKPAASPHGPDWTGPATMSLRWSHSSDQIPP